MNSFLSLPAVVAVTTIAAFRLRLAVSLTGKPGLARSLSRWPRRGSATDDAGGTGTQMPRGL